MTEDTQEKRFDVAVQVRNLEIDLFWKRSIFFWGFISSAFVGYAALHKSDPDLSVLMACFGTVCSFAWTLLNRGSKYWQESWEAKVDKSELAATGKFFALEEPEQTHKGWWLCARRFSVSKLAIALSDFVFVLWFLVLISEGLERYAHCYVAPIKDHAAYLFGLFSLVYIYLLYRFGRTTRRSRD